MKIPDKAPSYENPYSSDTPEAEAYRHAYDKGRLTGRLVTTELARQEVVAETKHDSLTGLLTKKAWLEEVNRRFAEADKSGEDLDFGVLFIDIRNFKAVNEEHSGKYDRGDQVLVDVAHELKVNSRIENGNNDILAHGSRFDGTDPTRLGGDELAIGYVLEKRKGSHQEMTPDERLDAIRERLQDKVFTPYLEENPDLTVPEIDMGFTIGTAVREPGENAQDLLARASVTMHEAKLQQREEFGSYR